MHPGGFGDHIVAIIGSGGVGKSTFIEQASRVRGLAHHGLVSPILTDNIRMVKTNHPEDGHSVMFLDTSIFGDHPYSSTDILHQIAQWLKHRTGDFKLSAIIYLHQISDPRMDGSLLKNLHTLPTLLGPKAMPNVIIATTMWSKVNNEEGKRREDDLRRILQGMVTNGCKIKRFENTYDSAWDIVGTSTTTISLQKLGHQGWFRKAYRKIFGW